MIRFHDRSVLAFPVVHTSQAQVRMNDIVLCSLFNVPPHVVVPGLLRPSAYFEAQVAQSVLRYL